MTKPVVREEIYDAISSAFASPLPVSTVALLETARNNGARREVVDILGTLPGDEKFRHLRELWEHLDVPIT